MGSNLKFAIEASVFWPPADRVVASGYKESIDASQVYELVSKVEGVDGVELYLPYDLEKAEDLLPELQARKLEVSAVGIGNFAAARFQRGGVTSDDPAVRKESFELGARAVQAAKKLGSKMVVFWPAHDGYDYYFQTDYLKKHDLLRGALRDLAQVDPEINIGIEYKPREPRTHQLVPNAAKALRLAESTGCANVGVIMDIGHSLLAMENPAEEAALLIREKRLFHLHNNDNYGDWDYDMIPGSVHFWEQLEFYWTLVKTGYSGWMNFDICPFREESVEACTLSIRHAKKLLELAGRLDPAVMADIASRDDAMAAQRYIWDQLFR